MRHSLMLLILAAVPAAASSITFTLVQANLTGSPGTVFTWQYDVVNNSGGDIYASAINAGTFTGGAADGSVFDDFGFNAISNGGSLVGTLYAFDSDPAVSNSFNPGIFDLTVSDSTFSNFTDVFANYSVTVQPSGGAAPEPGSMALAGLGLAGLYCWRRRKQKPE